MCGIVGAIDYSGSHDFGQKISAAADSISARGPDSAGVWSEGCASLAHRRLAILDTSIGGQQPMLSRCGRYVVVYNGEIYNFQELKLILDGEGIAWKSNSDTEVLLAAYVKWGAACLTRFRGMFAFAIWDRVERTLFAARDRLGVKPFYYRVGDKNFSFASRPRALFALHPGLASTIDSQGLRLYLDLGFIPEPWTFHEGMRKLPPAHFIVFSESGIRIERYWDFRSIECRTDWENRSESDLLDELDEKINQCVKLRMISDVPIGAFLSGGIDSSLVVGAMARHASNTVRTFTIGFEDSSYDESVHADRVARYLGTDHHTEILRVDDLLNLLPKFFDEYDEPFYDNSAFATMAVSRLASRNVKVSLSGDGGDELFGGYDIYRIVDRLQYLYSLPQFARNLLAMAIRSLPFHKMKLLGAALARNNAAELFCFIRSISKDFEHVRVSSRDAGTVGIIDLFQAMSKALPKDISFADRCMRFDLAYTLPDGYMQKVDVASMAFSLEAREPLLDHELVEWAMALPMKWKLRGNINKYLLRRLAYRYVPETILDRPKQGFAVPVGAWLRGPLRDWAEERLSDGSLLHRMALDQEEVRRLFDLHLSGKRNVAPALWSILMLSGYMEKHC